MNVASWPFLVFAAAVALGLRFSAAPAWRRAVLLLANLAFFFSFATSAVAAVPFALFLLAGFGAIKLFERRKSAPAIALISCALVLAFGWLKHYAFVPAIAYLPFAYETIGLSYVFFRMLALVKYAYQTAKPIDVDLITYLNFTLNFASLVAGPIQSTRDFRNFRSDTLPALDLDIAARALERIALGFLKVVVFSPLTLDVHRYGVAAAAANQSLVSGALGAALAAAAFTVYLYVNFSGYMDIVIGVARFVRIELPENFANPFAAPGFLDFWSRWHATLSNWLKTYVFSPFLMALMRRFRAPSLEPFLGVVAFFVTFFLVGVWHGQTPEFLAYGLLQGLGVSGNKLYQILMVRRLGWPGYRALYGQPLYAALSRGLTIAYFSFTLLWFWGTWPLLGRGAALLGASGIALAAIALIGGFTVALWALVAFQNARPALPAFSPYLRAGWSVAGLLAVAALAWALHLPPPYIVYAAF
jgi:D-alanyl-lipoteichoic acid acyltransferase DltB (MBOAT superfamily)